MIINEHLIQLIRKYAKPKEDTVDLLGKTGKLFTLFVSNNSLNDTSANYWLESSCKEIFTRLAESPIEDIGFWNGNLGNILVLEILDKLGLVESDIGNVLQQFDQDIINCCIKKSLLSNMEKPFLLKVLLNRMRHRSISDRQYIPFQLSIINICEALIQDIEANNFEINQDLYLTLSVLNDATQSGYYLYPITQFKKKACDKLLSLRNGYIPNVQEEWFCKLNTCYTMCYSAVVATEESEYRKIWYSLLLMFIQTLDDSVYKYENIKHAYLFFINTVINEKQIIINKSVHKFVQSQLNYDFEKIKKQNTTIADGILGKGGVILTLNSFFDPKFSAWTELLLLPKK